MARTPAPAALALVAASLLACELLLELLFVPLLPLLPRKLHVYLDEATRPLAQSSKRGARPRDYVAIVGDSYAQGKGDWLLESDPDRNGPFSSAHVLHERTGRDVVSFARGGAGAIAGWIAYPRLSLAALATSRRTAFEPPELVIAYFYEGNDLEDTLAELLALTIQETPELSAWSGPYGTLRYIVANRSDPFALVLENPRVRDPVALREAIEARFLPLYAMHRAAREDSAWPRPRFARFAVALAQGEIARLRGRAPGWVWEDGLTHPGTNRVVVAGAPREAPGSLQSPAMQLSPEETELAFATVELAFSELAASFPTSRLCLLHVPSPAALYEFADEPVSAQVLRTEESRFESAAIRARNAELDLRLRGLAERAGAHFVDATPPLRDAARAALIHGPRDWMHFNEPGQRVLGETAAGCLDAPPRA